MAGTLAGSYLRAILITPCLLLSLELVLQDVSFHSDLGNVFFQVAGGDLHDTVIRHLGITDSC